MKRDFQALRQPSGGNNYVSPKSGIPIIEALENAYTSRDHYLMIARSMGHRRAIVALISNDIGSMELHAKITGRI
jgi:hypothetical protein